MRPLPVFPMATRFACILLLLASLFPARAAIREDRTTGGHVKESYRRSSVKARAVTLQQRALADQAARANCRVEWDEEQGVPRSVRGKDLGQRGTFSRGKGLAVSGKGDYEHDALAVLDGLSGLYRMADAEGEFRTKRVFADRLGFHHVRLQQMLGGLAVQGGEVIVHFGKDNRAYEVNGRYLPDIKVALPAALPAPAAMAKAQADLIARKLPAGEADGDPALVVFTRREPARLAYAVTLVYRDAEAGAGRWRYWVDARTGEILDRYNDIQYIPAPTDNGSHSETTGSVLAGEGGGATSVTGWYDNVNTSYYLYNTNVHWIVENVAASGYPDANTFAFRPTSDWGTSDRTEVSAAMGFDLTQQYYSQVHGLDSFDGLGITARANVHEGSSYVNAYWDGNEFYFGDGDGATANSLAVLDIAGHEYTHAVTEYSASLVYQDEPGALNESFSDIFGTCIEFFGQPDDRASYPAKHAGMADWLCGEDSWLASTALRDLRNPANAVTVGSGNEQPTRYLGAYWYFGTGDNGGVHQNSGVQNFFFYLLCEGGSGNNDGISYNVTGIGITNAEQVAYRTLTVYCIPDTGYRAVRSAWLSAATDLDPAWASSAAAAWDAVGVHAVSVTPADGASFSGSEGGPFSPESVVFTILNADSSAVDWGMSHTQAWVNVSPRQGSIPAFGSQDVTVTINSTGDGLTGGTYTDTLVFTNSASVTADSRSVTLLVLSPVVYGFDLDTDPGWNAEGDWAYGVPQGAEGDPSAGATGPNVYGYNLAGAYADNIPVYALTTAPLDCSGYENVHLAFSRWLGVENSWFDHATLQVSTNGTDWAIVWDHTGDSFQDTSWQNLIYRLGAADGQAAVYIRWLMGPTDSSVTYSGWNLDDIRIHATARDALRVAPRDGLISQGYEGGPFTPTNRTYTIVNAGADTLDWTASSTSTWFSISSPGGSLAMGATALVSVALQPAVDAFAPGHYQDSVVFSNTASGFTTSRAVAVTVLAIPGEIGVTDSIIPDSDLSMPFGDVIIGRSRTEQITITNSDAVYPIIISRISFGSYLEDFDDGEAQNWHEDVDADWNVVAGEYQAQAAGEAFMMATYGGKSWDDLTAQMSCRRTGDAGYAAALVLRASADFDDGVGSAYVFQIAADGSYGVWKQVAGSWSWLQSWTASPSIQPGVNVLRATAQGDALSFFINGALVWNGSDASLVGGRVGLGGYTVGDTTHFFDDVMAGESLSTPATVSAAQAALNAHPSGGDPHVAPAGSGSVPGAPASLGTQTIVSGTYTIADEPASFPYSIPPHASITFNVIYTPTATATNEAEVVIENNDKDEPDVHVALSGRGIIDYIEISPAAGLVSRGHPGGAFTPTNLVYSLTNSSAMSSPWAAANTQNWVTVDPVGGTLDSGETQDVTVWINAAAAALGEGVYRDTVTFSNLNTGVVQARPVTLTVFTSPQVGVTPTEMWVTNTMGQSQTNTLTVSNGAAADGSLTFRLTSRSTGVTLLPFRGRSLESRIQPGHNFTKVIPGVDFVPGELLVRFAEGVNAPARAALLAALGGGEVRRDYRLVPGLALVKLPPAARVEDALTAFNGANDILYAEPNYTVQAFDTMPNDPRFGELWGLHNTGQTGGTPDADIDAPEAWDSRTVSTNVIVCVIDTGIDYNHEDLAGNMWHNPGEIPGNSIDDDSNGYVDDVYGINAITGSGDPMDDHDHGTHCSGTIGGIGNNGVGVAGVNWRVRLMGAKFLDADGFGDTADAVTCVEYAVDKGAKVLSNSWGGGGYSQAMKDAIDAADAAEIAFIAAAGNANSDNDTVPNYPCGYESDNVVSVMATDHNDLKSSFSSYGQTTVDLAAPGTDILSCKRGGGYVSFSGTSMATPHVAGAAALLFSADASATVGDIKQAMLNTVDVLFPTLCVSGGRLNLARALDEMKLPWLSFDPAAVTNVPAGASTDIQVGFHAGELEPAIYDGEIVLSCNDIDTPVVTVPVHMTILRDDLRIAPVGELPFSGVVGGPFDSAKTVCTVSNAGSSSLTWSLASAGTWLSASPVSGLLAPSEVNAVTVTVTAAADSLAIGDYRQALVFSNSLSGVTQKRWATLTVLPLPPVVIHSFPLDTDPGWTTEGQWAFGVPQGLDDDPTSGYTGANVYGYNLAGAYANDLPVYALTTPPLDCSRYVDVSLSFRRWLGVEDAWWDHATIEVSSDGANWFTVWDHVGDWIQDTSWQDVSYDISAVADGSGTVRIRWLMGPTDESMTYSGWNLDDIQLRGRPGDLLIVSPSAGLSSAGYRGGPFSPTHKVFTLINSGSTNLPWTAGCASAWVSVAPGGGTLATGATADVTVTINPEANTLVEGAYNTEVVFSNAATGIVLTRPVALAVQRESVSVSLPIDLHDGGGYLWDIGQDGSIADGTSDAYDGGHVLIGFPPFGQGQLFTGGREVAIGPVTNAGVVITRRIYVPADQAYARFLEVLRNVGASAVTHELWLDTDLGSDAGTVVVATSDGDTLFETTDNWIETDDQDGSGVPTILHVVANDHGRQRPSAVYYDTDYAGYDYRVVLPPGETRIVMHFGAQNPDRSTATDKAPLLTELGLGALAGISATELSQIVNFGLADTRTSRGTPVVWLQAHGLNTFDWEVEDMRDTDGDGMPAWKEFVADTDPTIGSSVLSILGMRLDGGTVQLDWKGGQWATQYIEVSDSLLTTGASWQRIGTNDGLPTFITNSATWNGVSNPTLFYRIQVER